MADQPRNELFLCSGNAARRFFAECLVNHLGKGRFRGAAQLDFVFAVCDQGAAQACPGWPGHPMTAHWGVENPAAANDVNQVKEAAFSKAFQELRNRVEIFVNLLFASLSKPRLKEKLDGFGRVALANRREKGSH